MNSACCCLFSCNHFHACRFVFSLLWSHGNEETGELVTPTAAALLTTLADAFGPLPAMTIRSIGYGAGTRDGKRLPNVLRVLVGQTAEDAEADSITVLETNLDDATPEMIGHCTQRLLAEGALDVYTVPIQMKKSSTTRLKRSLKTSSCSRSNTLPLPT